MIEDKRTDAEVERDEAEARERVEAQRADLRGRAIAAIEGRDAKGAKGLSWRGPSGLSALLQAPKVVWEVVQAVAKGARPDPEREREALAFLAGALPAPVDLGITELTGADASADARAAVREAASDEGALEGMLERLQARVRATEDARKAAGEGDGKPEVDPAHLFDDAFDPPVLAAAAAAAVEDVRFFQSIHRGLKLLKGFPLTQWGKAVEAEQRRQREAAKAAEQERERARQEKRRGELDAEREAARAELEAERDADDPERRDHYADVVRGPQRYTVRPGRVTLTEQRVDGRITTTDVARFSPIIAEQTLTFPAPDAPPDIELRLSVCLDRDGSVREVVLPARDLESPGWMLRKLGKDGGDTGAGRGAYEHLRRAMFAASADVTRTHRRYGYLGWVPHDGGLVYVHGGGAIGAAGAVPDLVATLPRALRHYVLPSPPEGVEAERAVAAVLRLLEMDPPTVTYLMAALTFHAPLGGNRLAFHGTGISDVGKSVRASLFQRFYGRAMGHKSPPGSWEGSPSGTYPLLAAAGDAVFWNDDLRSAVPVVRVDQILRAHFNESGAARGTREGGLRELPMSRCDLLSVGEIEPRGETASTLNRILTVDIATALPPETGDLYALASAGAFDAAMALNLRWLAPRIEAVRASARGEERAAAERWGFDLRDRTGELMGGYALGMEYLLAFLDAHGVPNAVVERHRQGAAEAFAEVARGHRARVATDDVGRRLLDLVMDAIGAGRAHTPAIVLSGVNRSKRTAPPADPHAWGYRMQGEEIRPSGDCVGYHLYNKVGMVHLLPGPAVAVAMREARMRGRDLGGDLDSLARALHAHDHLAETTLNTSRGKIAVQVRIADGSAPEAWAVRLSSLVGKAEPEETPATDPTAPADAAVTPHGGYEVEEFPDDLDPFSPLATGIPPP